jgi:hypothetical protein
MAIFYLKFRYTADAVQLVGSVITLKIVDPND